MKDSPSSQTSTPTLPEPAVPANRPGLWKAGTLTYTTAGVVGLFAILLAGDFVWSMRERSVGPLAQWYLHQLKVPNLLFGLLTTSFPALVGLIFSPILSVKSDRHRGRLGRRLPFLLLTTPIAVAGMFGLAFTPRLAAWFTGKFPGAGETTVALLCFGVFWAAFEFATITVKPVFDGLINDVVPRPLLGRFYGLFRAISLIDGMIFNYWIVGHAPDPDHFTAILLAIATVYGIAFTWVCLKVREGRYPPPPALENRRGPLRQTLGYFKECFGIPYYCLVFLLMMLAMLAFTPLNTFGIPYSLSLGISMETYGKSLALTYLISLGLSFFLGWLVDLFHPLRVVMAALAGYAAVMLFSALWVNSQTSFLVAWVLHGVLSGCYFTAAASLGQRLFPQARFAQFASAASMVLAAGQIALAPAMGTAIDLAGSAYRLTFFAAFAVSLAALLVALPVYRSFLRLGGFRDYIAPE